LRDLQIVELDEEQCEAEHEEQSEYTDAPIHVNGSTLG
jgi:cytoskeletal protein RodZ